MNNDPIDNKYDLHFILFVSYQVNFNVSHTSLFSKDAPRV